MNQSYENLKLYFSSRNCSTNCNLSHLVIFAEHAVKENNLDVAADCLRIYFSHNPPCNQFYIRGHLCEALITAPTSPVNKIGLTECLNSIVKAVDVAREFECYHFLIYNCSVLLWQICRPYQHPGLCRLYAKPLQYVIRALEECKDQDWKWRLELLIGLIHSQMDAGHKEDAARTCLNAVNLARKKSPSQLIEVLKLQMYYNLGEVKKDAAISSEWSALCQLYKTKGIAHQQDLTSTDLEQKLRKVLTIISGAGGLNSPVSTSLKETQVPFLLELGMFSIEYHLTELAQECLVAVCAANISHDPKLTLMKESLVYQLSIQDLVQAEELNNHGTADAMLKLLLRIADLLTASKKTRDFNLVQYICVVLWNLSFPLLQQNSCHQLLKPLSVVANALKEISSVLFKLRATVHFEIAKIMVSNMDLKSGLKHVKEALALDMLGEHSEHWTFFEKQLTLRAQLYATPTSHLDHAMTSVKCASIVHSVEELRPLLVKAGELLAPNYFTDALRKYESKEINAKDYEQQKDQFKEFMATTGNENDKERCLILADMVKTACRKKLWDIASVACQLCLCYDDGRWKASKPVTKSRSPHHLPYNTSLDNMVSHSDSGQDHEFHCGKFTTEMIRLLAEIHCIYAECLMNQLQQGIHSTPSCSTHDPSIQRNQTAFKEWVSIVCDDVTKALLRAAELGCALGEPWLVYNAACSLWNYSHDWVKINEGSLIKVCRQLLPIIKQIDLGRDSVLGILVCTALSIGLIDKWTHAKPESSIRASTAGKKNGQNANKKGKDNRNSEQVHVDPEGSVEIKEALEVCEYAMEMYSDVPLLQRRKLLETWVKCKVLLQQSIPTKTYGIGESKDCLNCRAIVAIEMADLVCRKGLSLPSCPTPYEILTLLSDCQWRDAQIEMELWIKLATTAITQNDYELIHLCCKNVAKIHANMSKKPECPTVEKLLLSISNYFNGQGLSLTAAGNTAVIRKALDCFLISARLGCSSGSYCLVMKACCQYWNTCLPLAASSFGRELLCDPVLELLSLVATFLGRGKDEPLEKDQDTLLAMYGLVFQALSDQHKWELGLKVVEDAMLTMPKAISHHLIKHKLMFKSRLGKNMEGDIMMFSEQPKHVLASLWHQTAKYACDQTEGLKAYRNAIQLLQSEDCSWQKVEYLVEFSEWLHQHQFPPEVSLDHLQNVVDIILHDDSSAVPDSLNMHQLEVLMRVHVMMSQLHRKGSYNHKQLSIAALGFCFQLWKLMYGMVPNSGKSKDSGSKLPSTVAEWALFEVPQELIDGMKTGSCNSKEKKSFTKNPMLSLHYLGVLAKSLSEVELEALATPVLHLQFVIASSLVKSSEPICKLIHMRIATLSAELGLTSDHSDKLCSTVLSSKHLTRSLMEIQQYNTKKRVVERSVSKYTVPNQKVKSEESPGTTQSTYKMVIRDGIVLREVCARQAMILVSQGEYQHAHELLNHALISCQIFADTGTLFLVFCGLAILSLVENKRSKAVHYLIAAQNLSCNLEHWMDGVLLLSDCLTTGRDAVHSSLLELFVTSLGEKMTNNADHGIALLTHRLKLLVSRNIISSHSGEFPTPFGIQSLQYYEADAEAGDWLLKQDCYFETAQILHQQAKHARSMAEGFLLDVQNYQHYLLQALRLYEKSVTLLHGLYESVRFLCQPSKKVSLHIQREVIHAMLGSAEVLLAIFERYSDLKMLDNHGSSVESVIKGYIDEVSVPTLIEEEWKATAISAVERGLGILSAAYLLAQGDESLEARCAYGFGCCFHLLSRHSSPLWQFHRRDEPKIEPKLDEINKKSLHVVKINEAITVHFLLQASNSLSEALSLALTRSIWTLGASIAVKIIDCSGTCDPATASLYLTLYQTFIASMKLKKVLMAIHSDPSTSQLGTLLEQQDRFSEVKVWPALQANTDKLRDYEVFRRLQIAENHLEFLKMFPANFRFILLQHSLDRSRLLTAYLIPTQSQLSVTKKGQPLQQTESSEPVISFTDVSVEDYKQLQELITAYQASRVHNNCDLLKEGPSLNVLSAMEQYFANALKSIANSLRIESGDKDLNIIILGDNDLLALPLESMAIFQQNHITSVSRDFSLQMFHYRMLMFDVNEEAVNTKDKKKTEKQQPQATTVVADTSRFKYILDPKNGSSSSAELLDAVGSLVNLMQSCTRITSKWSGYTSPESKISLNEWSLLLKNASGILYFGTESVLTHYPATLLTSLNLQNCHVMLVVDNVQTYSKEASKRESSIQSLTVLSMMLSLAGAGCIVTNQSSTSIKSNSSNINNVIRGLLVDGSTIGQVNWTTMKNKHVEVHSSTETNREVFSNDTEMHVEENNCEESYKENDYNTAMVVYGLPHIVLSN